MKGNGTHATGGKQRGTKVTVGSSSSTKLGLAKGVRGGKGNGTKLGG